MSEENVEVVQAAFDAFERGDVESVLNLCDEDIEIVQPAELPGVSPRQHGHAGVLEAFAIWPEQWDDFRVEVVGIADMGDRVLVRTLQHGRGRDSGVPVETRFTFLFALRGGKVVEWRMFMREEDALEAAGRRERD
jgi:ketosteroid isomerase-like protein